MKYITGTKFLGTTLIGTEFTGIITRTTPHRVFILWDDLGEMDYDSKDIDVFIESYTLHEDHRISIIKPVKLSEELFEL